MSESVIKVEGLCKRYALGTSHSLSLTDYVKMLFRQNSQVEMGEFWALKDVSFEIGRGEAIGIIGKNGAGKSTLLKVLSRITHPTAGRIEMIGRVASLLEVGTGFHPELSGRENIYLNGTILGMSRREVKTKFDEIVAFSGVEKFIDTPVKHYSSGMYVRLAFSVAAHLEPEILIIDEVLAVGDMEFQKKCLGKMDEVSSSGRTVLFVSHNIDAITALCQKAIILENGKLIYNGVAEQGVKLYLQKEHQNKPSSYNWGDNPLTEQGLSLTQLGIQNEPGNIIKLKIGYDVKENFRRIDFSFHIFNQRSQLITIVSSSFSNMKRVENSTGSHSCTFEIEGGYLVPGIYNITFRAIANEASRALMRLDECFSFEIADENSLNNYVKQDSLVNLPHRITSV